MIKYAASPDEVIKPKVKVSGVSVSSISIVYEIGKIPVAQIGAPPEFSEGMFASQTENEVEVTVSGGSVSDETVFKGYFAGPHGSSTMHGINYGNNIIHLARDLDQTMLFSPGLHPLSTDDLSMYVNLSAGSNYDPLCLLGKQFDIKSELVSEFKRIVEAVVQGIQSMKKPSKYGELASMTQSAGDVEEMLNKIEAMVPCRLDSSIASSQTIPVGAARFVAEVVTASQHSRRSVWDVFAVLFSLFGMVMVCTPDGKVKAMPNFSGCRAPSGNKIDEMIVAHEYTSTYMRNINGVVAMSQMVPDTLSGPGSMFASNTRGDGQVATMGMYPPDLKKRKPGGGVLVTGLPKWMTPQVGVVGQMTASVPQKALDDFAKSIFMERSFMGRSAKVVTPFSPSAIPGTTVAVNPASKIKFLSGGGDAGTSKEYTGLLVRVVHHADVAAKQFQTEWHLRTLYSEDEYGDLESAPPFFSGGVKPFGL